MAVENEGVGGSTNPSKKPGPPAVPLCSGVPPPPTAALGPTTLSGNGDNDAGGNGNNAAHVYANDPASPPETVDPPSPPPPPSPPARGTPSPTPSQQALKEDNTSDWFSARTLPDQASTRVAPWNLHGDWARAQLPHSQHAAATTTNNNNNLPPGAADLVISDDEEDNNVDVSED